MKNLKFIAGIFLTAGFLFSCSNEENTLIDNGDIDNGNTEKTSAITVDLLVATSEGTAGNNGTINTRGKDDVDAAGTTKGTYNLGYVYLVKANSKIPAEKFEDSRKMDLNNKRNGQVKLWIEGDKVMVRPVNDVSGKEPLSFRFTKLDDDNYPVEDEDGYGETFFYSSVETERVSLPIDYEKKEEEGRLTSKEFGDKLFSSPQYVFVRGTEDSNPIEIYQVYPTKGMVYPKAENSLWPIQMERNAAVVNLKFMFVDVDDAHPYGTKVDAIRDRWNLLFGNAVDLDAIRTDGAKIMNCPSSFDICSLKTLTGKGAEYTNLSLFNGEMDGGDAPVEMEYRRVTDEEVTPGIGFATKEYPFIFPILEFDALSRVQVSIYVKELNARLKCSVRFPQTDMIAFKSNITTFLWVMLDIDQFKKIYDQAKEQLKSAPQTRSGGIREIEVELPEDCLKVVGN